MPAPILSPWPTTPAASAAALTCLKEAVRATRGSDDRLGALGAAASAIVEYYAAGAPQPVRNEATIRLAGWVLTSFAGDLVPTGVGPVTMTFRPTVSRNALRSSGAMGLLSPWHKAAAVTIDPDAPEPAAALAPADPGAGVTREELERILDQRLRNLLEWPINV